MSPAWAINRFTKHRVVEKFIKIKNEKKRVALLTRSCLSACSVHVQKLDVRGARDFFPDGLQGSRKECGILVGRDEYVKWRKDLEEYGGRT